MARLDKKAIEIYIADVRARISELRADIKATKKGDENVEVIESKIMWWKKELMRLGVEAKTRKIIDEEELARFRKF